MGSGTFPLSYGDECKRLKDAADAVHSVLDEMSSDVYSGDSGGCQFDNAAIDGGYLARLEIAESLIRDCIKK